MNKEEYTIILRGPLTIEEDKEECEERIRIDGNTMDYLLLQGLPITLDRIYKDGFDDKKYYGEAVVTVKVMGRKRNDYWVTNARRYTFQKPGFTWGWEIIATSLEDARVKLAHESNQLDLIEYAITAEPVKIECLCLQDTGLYAWGPIREEQKND